MFQRMFRSRSWFGGGGGGPNAPALWKPKNPHSLEYLKYLHGVLSKNTTVTEQNKSLLVETLRSIAEILIWGDQNDSTVFDFFLEKSMLSYFLEIMKQRCGSYVCVQLLQTLNILFENIRNETSLYYLLSNNHVNSIIEHKFDFSDEEVMAYYISFLKTLSLKLNPHTVHFFYNEHTHDFPLYTEAIKFFNNSESMVRIAVRTLTLNVYRVDDKSMLQFIRDKTAAPYFSNLVWFIGNHVLEIDAAVKKIAEDSGASGGTRGNDHMRLDDLVAEHLDHLHYVNDILLLQISDLNQVLVDHLLTRLFIPKYIHAFSPGAHTISRVLSLFLLSQVFTIVTDGELIRLLAHRLLTDIDVLSHIDVSENDYGSFYSLTLVWALLHNEHVQEIDKVRELFTNRVLMRKLTSVIAGAVKFDTRVRVSTLRLSTSLIDELFMREGGLDDLDLATIESHREENILTLQNYFKTDEMFLEVFEDEYGQVERLRNKLDEFLNESGVFLLPPVGSPLSFVHLDKRMPCGDGERCRRAMRVYFILRKLSLKLRREPERLLPLTSPCAHLEQNLDLTNSDLLSCTVLVTGGNKLRRFLVVDAFQIILVEPSLKRMGWGVVKFVGFLQDLEVQGDQGDSRCLHITVKTSPVTNSAKPALVAKFIFDDHIRCMAARQRLLKGRQKARDRKLHMISRLLDQQLVTKCEPDQLAPSTTSSISSGLRSTSRSLPGTAVPHQVIHPPHSIPMQDIRRTPRSSPPPSSSELASPEEQETKFFIDEEDVKHV